MSEFGWIARYFAPLAETFPGAHGLLDDAATIALPPGQELTVTKDVMNAGVHFFGHEPASLIARKLLRVNLSDLAAKGAVPYIYFLGLSLPRETHEAWIRDFAGGLREDQAQYGITLAGGDTTATEGPLSLSLTALGLAPAGQTLRRSGAQAGDDIYVSGTLGDAALGLRLLQSDLHGYDALIERYHLPQPRMQLGPKLRGIANACMDISDGLLQDLGHLCKASDLGAELALPALPLSADAQALLKQKPEWQESIYAGGDDYELLFTAPATKREMLSAFEVTRIGKMIAGNGVTLLDAAGKPVPITRTGYQHF